MDLMCRTPFLSSSFSHLLSLMPNIPSIFDRQAAAFHPSPMGKIGKLPHSIHPRSASRRVAASCYPSLFSSLALSSTKGDMLRSIVGPLISWCRMSSGDTGANRALGLGSHDMESGLGLADANADMEKKRRPGWRRTKRSRP